MLIVETGFLAPVGAMCAGLQASSDLIWVTCVMLAKIAVTLVLNKDQVKRIKSTPLHFFTLTVLSEDQQGISP